MKILEFKRSGIGLIVEFRGIPNGFPNLVIGNIMESFIHYYYSMKIRGVASPNIQGWDATT
jgi:hypothetical protein